MSEATRPAERPGRTSHDAIVTRVARPVPSVVRLTFHADTLATFASPSPGAHVKIGFPSDAAGRPVMRTYTPRRFDAERCELEIEFFLHGDGVASEWAAAAQVGERLTIMGPGGRYRPSAQSGVFVIAVDDTALPAAGTVIDALAVEVEVIALCEVGEAADQRPLSAVRDVDDRWLHRAPAGAEPGVLLAEAIEQLPPDLDADWFVACEAGAMRRIRTHLLTERRVVPGRVQTRGYWRRGEKGYPDHDYGDD